MTDVGVYLRRTEQLAYVRDFIKDDPYPSAVALLAVHSVIALNDAVLTVLTGVPYKGQDHREAVRQIEAACKQEKLDSAGIKHLSKLIRAKTDVSYGSREVTLDQSETLRVDAERLETWAYKLLKNKSVLLREL